MKKLAILLTMLIATPVWALKVPDFETGKGCWKYGVLENSNTGQMTAVPLDEIPVVKLGYDDLLVACGLTDDRTLGRYWRDRGTLEVRACFAPRKVDGNAGHDTIYLLKWYAGKFELYQEMCHAKLGRKHNACYPHYGIGKDESACNWDET